MRRLPCIFGGPLSEGMLSGSNNGSQLPLWKFKALLKVGGLKEEFLASMNTIFTLSIGTPQLLTILVLEFEQVQFTIRCFVSKLLDEWQTV